jgi:hypothetical protein
LNRGQIASDLAGVHDFRAIVLQDTTDIAHGMTGVAATGTYCVIGKADNAAGGAFIAGLTESNTGLLLAGMTTTADTTTSTAAVGAVYTVAAKKSGTGVTAYGDTENIFVAANNYAAKFIVKGNGNFHYDGTGSAYDAHDDVSLLRTLARETWSGVVDSTWDRFVTTNRQSLIDAGILSEDGFISGAALNRLLTGAVWQLNERIKRLEGLNG